jgi:oligoendopeptidase F
MVHEGGHAVHSFLAHNLELTSFKEYPMEIAEVASMAMELFTMDNWHVFFTSDEELNQAKEHQLERVITIFPWIATIDKFQHWLYENPNHTEEARSDKWVEIFSEFTSPVLGAIGLWKQFKENKEQALNNYITALAQGGTRTLPELFQLAGLRFDFSPTVVGTLMAFVHDEMRAFTKN